MDQRLQVEWDERALKELKQIDRQAQKCALKKIKMVGRVNVEVKKIHAAKQQCNAS